jgi:hypothetical protein
MRVGGCRQHGLPISDPPAGCDLLMRVDTVAVNPRQGAGMDETTPDRRAAVGSGLLAGGGMMAAFGAAACCGLPVPLGASCIAGGAWLLDVAAACCMGRR